MGTFITKKQQELIDSLQPMELCISNEVAMEPGELVELLVGSRLADIRYQYEEDKDDNLIKVAIIIETADGSVYTLKLLGSETYKDYDIVEIDYDIDSKLYGPTVERAVLKINSTCRYYNDEDDIVITTPRVIQNYIFGLSTEKGEVDIILATLTDSTDNHIQIIKTIKS